MGVADAKPEQQSVGPRSSSRSDPESRSFLIR